MRIYDIFEHKIDRDYKGVINVGQDDRKNVEQELSEYVVTRELQRHFRDFFRAYTQSIGKPYEKMGVWISGFFGSGKSHLLKILSYLLENRVVDDKPAISYFTDSGKIGDPTILADIKKAGSVSADIILFNIGAKADTTTQAGRDTITAVFLRVFNDRLGYCASMPFLADIERSLEDKGLYQAFQQRFEEIEGRTWQVARDDFFFIQDALVEALVSSGAMSEAAARATADKASDTYEMSTENFARMVKAHCDRQGPDHHIVFLADEVGQFISEDSQMMLNLQNISEDLGRICRGKSWVIVTSQQDMGKALDPLRARNDFSRIQDRFETRLSLTAANADEVVRKRVLQKTQTAESSLSVYYEQKNVVLKNLLNFQNTATMPLYSSPSSFIGDYPFVPYQFNLMGRVLTAIRENAATGMNLAHGERSLLALFMKSAIAIKDDQIGVLAPVPLFYGALKDFVDSVHATVINKAAEGNVLEPFDVELLKLLFMIKYIKEIPGNIENLTTMMVAHVDEDRLALTKKVEESLRRLINETLIQRSGDIYTFLTNQEQDINRAIGNVIAEMSEITAYTAQDIYEVIYRDRKFRYNARYNFEFNRMVDGTYYGTALNEKLGVNVLTPYADAQDDQSLRMQSSQNHIVLVNLQGSGSFLTEIGQAIRLTKYLRMHGVELARNYPGIKGAKEAELANIKERVQVMLRDALSHADIFVRGEKMNIPGRDPVDRMNEALGKQVQHLYHRLGDMQTAPSQSDIENLLVPRIQTQFDLNQQTPNAAALQDLLGTLELLARQAPVRTTLKTLLDRYIKDPYGYVPLDVQWMTAYLFANGKLTWSYNNETLSLAQTPRATLINYLTRQEHRDKLVIELRVEVPASHIKAAEDIMRQWFNINGIPANEDQIMADFRQKADNKSLALEGLLNSYLSRADLPGKTVLEQARSILGKPAQYRRAAEFFRYLFEAQGEWSQLLNALRPVESFLKGEQKGIFEKALDYRKRFDQSRAYITDRELIDEMAKIEAILDLPSPYGKIYQLPPLLEAYGTRHIALLEGEDGPVRARVHADRQTVLDALEGSPVKDDMQGSVLEAFASLEERLSNGKSIAEIRNIGHESDATKINLLNEIARKTADLVPQPSKPGDSQEPPKPLVARQPVFRHVSINSLLSASTTLQSPEQVETFISQLKIRLLEELAQADGINVVL